MNKDKVLLLKDLSSRLPYSPIVHIKDEDGTEVDALLTTSTIDNLGKWVVKPYLRPMSSMTDDELVAFLKIRGMNLSHDKLQVFRKNDFMIANTLSSYSRSIDWLNKNMFDYRGLIPLGLAIEAPSDMYKEE